MRTLFIATKACLLAALLNTAQLSSADNEEPATQQEQTPATEIKRDPFWPVGYKPRPKDNKQEAILKVQAVAKWPSLILKGITTDSKGKNVALLKDVGFVQAGDIAELKRGNLIYRWKINSISKEGVNFERLDVMPARN